MTILYCVTIQNKRVDFLKTLYFSLKKWGLRTIISKVYVGFINPFPSCPHTTLRMSVLKGLSLLSSNLFSLLNVICCCQIFGSEFRNVAILQNNCSARSQTLTINWFPSGPILGGISESWNNLSFLN